MSPSAKTKPKPKPPEEMTDRELLVAIYGKVLKLERDIDDAQGMILGLESSILMRSRGSM
jgi:hypothetical protein